jgi:monoamine oxidase
VHGTIEYAIIGGGVAGTYCAWRLKKEYPDKEIVLFEYSNRIGGRLLTTSLPGTNMKIELGGMRYIHGSHRYFTYLVDIFNLNTRDFLMGSKDDPEGKKNYAYFRGERHRISDLANPKKFHFNIEASERNKTPDQLQGYVEGEVKRLAKKKPKKLDDWFDIPVHGKHLWEHGFWNLLFRFLSPEAYQFLKYGSGYDTNVSNGNAVVLLPTGGDYSSSNKYLTLADGMDTLPKTLCEEFCKKGGECQLNHRLDSIKREGKDYKLHFTPTRTENEHQEKTISTDEPPYDYNAKRVILAMPKAALERIDWEPFKDPEIKKNLDSVLGQEAVKILLGYDHAWWKQLGIVYGRSLTDLPLRQTYYFTDPSDEDPTTTSRTPGVLMASYSDIESVPFWHGLEKSTDYAGPEKGYRATIEMVNEAHRQVEKIHGTSPPLPGAAAYYDWGDMPSGGGWHCWRPGYKYKDIMKNIRHPVKDEEVYICGEAYSANQGWVEGALETAELLLKDLGLPSILANVPRAFGVSTYGFDGKHLYDSKGRLVE